MATKNKTYYRVEVYFGDNSAVYGNKHSNFSDCINEFNSFIRSYKGNHIVSASIQKRYDNGSQVVSCRR